MATVRVVALGVFLGGVSTSVVSLLTEHGWGRSSPAAALLVGPTAGEGHDEGAKEAWRRCFEVRAVDATGVTVGSATALSSRRLVTNRHVVSGAQRVDVTRADGSRRRARVVFLDDENDVALLEMVAPADRPGLGTDSDRVVTAPAVPGTVVTACGHPESGAAVLREGRVAGVVDGAPHESALPVLALDLAVAPGFSGGGVFDAEGRLVGVIARRSDRTDLLPSGRSAAIAVPVQRLPGG